MTDTASSLVAASDPLLSVPPEILDPAVIRGHLDILGEECVAGIIAKFLDTTPETAGLIAQAARSGDLKVLSAQAHKMGSAALTLGLPALTDHSRNAERLAKSGQAEAAVAAADAIGPALDSALDVLRRVQASLSA